MALASEKLSPQTLGTAHAPGCRYSIPDQVDVLTVAGELDPARCSRCRYLSGLLLVVSLPPVGRVRKVAGRATR
jgi:hypothetical protein